MINMIKYVPLGMSNQCHTDTIRLVQQPLSGFKEQIDSEYARCSEDRHLVKNNNNVL